jgi:hypothetical protein
VKSSASRDKTIEKSELILPAKIEHNWGRSANWLFNEVGNFCQWFEKTREKNGDPSVFCLGVSVR